MPGQGLKRACDGCVEETEEEGTEEESVSPEQMDLIKYNYYVELNNEIVKLMDDIDYYYEVVEYDEEFALIPDSGYTYGYRIRDLARTLQMTVYSWQTWSLHMRHWIR